MAKATCAGTFNKGEELRFFTKGNELQSKGYKIVYQGIRSRYKGKGEFYYLIKFTPKDFIVAFSRNEK